MPGMRPELVDKAGVWPLDTVTAGRVVRGQSAKLASRKRLRAMSPDEFARHKANSAAYGIPTAHQRQPGPTDIKPLDSLVGLRRKISR
jgi:hypothetical protein